MDFTTWEYYLYFLPAVVLLTFAFFKGRKFSQMVIICLSSYFFFFLASGWHVVLLWFSTFLDWNVAKKIHLATGNAKKNWLKLSLVLNLLLLGIFKYLDFIISSLNLISLNFWWASEIDPVGILLPVGISFYTFQTMSYSIDVYKGNMEPYDSPIDFAAYAAFFPQLVAGPIVRASHFKTQIKTPLFFNSTAFRIGISMILYGLVKKIVFANNFAAHVDAIFLDGQPLENSALVWWGTLCFGLQIYCDFSAYTDIALGSAIILGIKIPENFNFPYIATSPQDFWRRWHISLSTWLRDYLYIPLGGSRNGNKRLVFALMGTMLLGGLWHGASWNFVLWGFVHGIILLAHRVLSSSSITTTLFENKYSRMPMILISWATTQFLVFMTWLIFRVEDTNMLNTSLKSFIGYNSYFDFDEAVSSLPEVKLVTLCLVLILVIFHPISHRLGRGRDFYSKSHPIIWGLITSVFILAMLFLRPETTSEFIYFRF